MRDTTISVSLDGTIITIDGLRFAREFFQHLAEDAIGSVIEIVKREDGVVTARHVGPPAPPAPDATSYCTVDCEAYCRDRPAGQQCPDCPESRNNPRTDVVSPPTA